eukprot:15450344-Alexandrium_andersonii.AAC.1
MQKLLEALEPGIPRAQKRPQSRSLKPWRGGLCASVSHRCRICRQSGPVGALEALLGRGGPHAPARRPG